MRTVRFRGRDKMAIVLIKTMGMYALTALRWLEIIRNSENEFLAFENVESEVKVV